MEVTIRYRGRGCNQTKIIFTEEVYVLDITEEQRAWLAGLMDAEGTFTMRVTEQSAVVTVYNNEVKMLEEAVKILGMGKIEKVLRKKRSDKHADAFMLTFQNQREVCKSIEVVLPYLRLKRKQAELLKRSCQLARCDRFEIINEVHALNAKGHIISYNEKNFTKTVEYSFISSTYFAGYLEGDGTFGFLPHKFGGFYPVVVLIGTKLELFKELQNIFGGYLHVRSKEKTPEGWSRKIELAYQDKRSVKEVLQRVRPYIKTRREELDLLLDSFILPANERKEFRDKLLALRKEHK